MSIKKDKIIDSIDEKIKASRAMREDAAKAASSGSKSDSRPTKASSSSTNADKTVDTTEKNKSAVSKTRAAVKKVKPKASSVNKAEKAAAAKPKASKSSKTSQASKVNQENKSQKSAKKTVVAEKSMSSGSKGVTKENRNLREKFDRIALLAGEGYLPYQVYNYCKEEGVACSVLGFENQTTVELYEPQDIEVFALSSISKIIKHLKATGAKDLILAGKIKRPNLYKLLLDVKGAKLFASIVRNGLNDDSILRTVITFLEKEGFKIHAADKIFTDMVAEKRCYTKAKPDKEDMKDINKGVKILKGISEYDVGQALVIQAGLILGVEAAEGTDELIKRSGSIQQKGQKLPLLIKVMKVRQDIRVDLPCIGETTIQNLKDNNIKGVAIESGKTYIVNLEETVKLANKYNIFIYGV